MKTFKLLVSFDGALSVVEKLAVDVEAAMDAVSNDNPGRVAILVKVLP